MGLDTTRDAWRGAYGAFSRWRNIVAEAAGYEVAKVEGGYGLRPTVLIDWGHIEPKNYEGDWDETPSDPLIILIAHSDCDGYIEPEHAALLADRLEGLLPALEGVDVGGHAQDVAGKTRTFIAGCRAAAEAGERLEFF